MRSKPWIEGKSNWAIRGRLRVALAHFALCSLLRRGSRGSTRTKVTTPLAGPAAAAARQLQGKLLLIWRARFGLDCSHECAKGSAALYSIEDFAIEERATVAQDSGLEMIK
jgi:hypothetical protein